MYTVYHQKSFRSQNLCPSFLVSPEQALGFHNQSSEYCCHQAFNLLFSWRIKFLGFYQVSGFKPLGFHQESGPELLGFYQKSVCKPLGPVLRTLNIVTLSTLEFPSITSPQIPLFPSRTNLQNAWSPPRTIPQVPRVLSWTSPQTPWFAIRPRLQNPECH